MSDRRPHPKPVKRAKALNITDEVFESLNKGFCRSCGAPIRWYRTSMGWPMPVNEDKSTHFATCPQAKQWSGKNKPRKESR